MADRKVTATGKDKDGDITKLCNTTASWSPQTKAQVIHDIEKKAHTYFVQVTGATRANIEVVDGPTGKYIRTHGDTSQGNNLDELPDC